MKKIKEPNLVKIRSKLSHEDKTLWKRVADTITPLSQQRGQILKDEMAKLLEAAAPAYQQSQTRELPMSFVSSLDLGKKDRSKAIPATNPIEERILKKLGTGRQSIDARVDLHGMSQDRARFALLDFLQMAQRANYRIVLVITGRGNEGRGVLRTNVPRWLSLPGFTQLVNGYRESHGAHGGEGALYVRIRKMNRARRS